MKSYRIIIMAVIALMTCSCMERISVNDETMHAPQVSSFEPASAPVGAVVTVTGKYLDDVNAAYIGDKPALVVERVSDTRLSIRVGEGSTSGVITLENAAGKGSSEKSFTCTYAMPVINAGLLQKSADMGSEMLVAGENLNAVTAVIFTAEGLTEGHSASITSIAEDEIIVRVPYVEGAVAKITLEYFDGKATVVTSLDAAPSLSIVRLVPTFDAYSFTRTAVGKSITLTGSNLDKVDKVLVGGFEANISKQPSSLTFSVPAGNFPDGETVTDVVVEYFDGFETKTLANDFKVYVPFVKYWENVVTSGHAKSGPLACFFSPETGMVYANSDWGTKLDPVSFEKKAATCSAAQIPAVSKEEYESVVPYFFFYSNNSSALAITSPANSNSLLKNFWAANVSGDANRLPGGNVTCFGTPVLGFRELKASNPAEEAIINAVLGEKLEIIDEKSFPIDVTAQTVAGVSVTAPSGALTDTKWAPADSFGDRKSDVLVKMDAVVMVLYYDYNGWGPASVNKLSNVKRIGFIHVTKVDFKIDQSNSAKPATLSEYTFNCYWQKYDYDYSKL
ncbi:MAG: IPT/TIG domain-containing protein [Bacteroidales bacterium]|nr:IPT/TIG domain-containing protein [Bacteroidales bacterium]